MPLFSLPLCLKEPNRCSAPRCFLCLSLSYVCWVENIPQIIIYIQSILSYKWQWINLIKMYSSEGETPPDISLKDHSLSESCFALHFKMPSRHMLYTESSCSQVLSYTEQFWTTHTWELTGGQVRRRCGIRPNYWLWEMVMPVYTLMDCKWLAGIMTKWKQSAFYPWALFSTWVMKEQLFWTDKAYLTKCGVKSSPLYSFFKWDLAVYPFVLIVIEW